jgi:hypothetical protein
LKRNGRGRSNNCLTLDDPEIKYIPSGSRKNPSAPSASTSDQDTIVRIYSQPRCRVVRRLGVAENGTESLIARIAESWKVAYHWWSTRSKSGRQYLMFGWVKVSKSVGSPHLDRFCCRLSNQSHGRPRIMRVRPLLCMEVINFLNGPMILVGRNTDDRMLLGRIEHQSDL